MLRCADGSYYTGHSEDLDTRVAQHKDGTYRGYTHTRRPVKLVWSQEFGERDEAMAAELQVKNWSRKKKEALIAGDWARVSYYAVPPKERKSRGATKPLYSAHSLAEAARNSPSTSLGNAESGAKPPIPAPIIVLVNPQLGENIGKAARAMLNFGLTQMRLVAPRDGWPNPSAGPAASGADQVLENAQVFGTLAEALADCSHVYATTVRKRGVTKPVVTPEVAAQEIIGQQGQSAFLFGPERSGLETDHVALARKIITVPINPEFGSLNLAQAVILCAYEWSKHQGAALESPPTEELLPPAPQEELDGLITHVTRLLEDKNYFFPEDRRVMTERNLVNLLTKPAWNHLEVRTMRGVLSALEKPARRTQKAD